MVIVHRHPFGVSRFHREHRGPVDLDAHAGLVMPVRVRFKSWQAGQAMPAEAFLDSGADTTIFSLRWIAENGPPLEHPVVDPWNRIVDEGVSVEIGGRIFRVPLGPMGPLLCHQGEAPVGWEDSTLWEDTRDMPGSEDILLGRDFFRAHDLLVLVDYSERCFSLLHPGDEENLRRRDAVLGAFDSAIAI